MKPYKLSKKIGIAIFASMISIAGTAQTEVVEGAKMPDLKLKNVQNYSSSEINTATLKKKLLIFDFWGLHCSGCIASFPKLDSLQRKFDSSIQIILVNNESIADTRKFFATHSYLKKPGVPFVVGDSVLHKLFPHLSVPHIVFVDNGKVLHIAFPTNMTEGHIKKMIAGEPIKLKRKYELNDYDGTKPPIAEGNGRWFPVIKYYSYLMPFRSEIRGGMSNGIKRDSVGGYIELQQSVASIPLLYAWIYTKGQKRGGRFVNRNSFAFEVKDTTPFFLPKDHNLYDDWNDKYLFTYEQRIPMKDSARLFDYMEQDLKRYFPYDVSVEQRRVPCLVLSQADSGKVLKTKGGAESQRVKTENGHFQSVQLRNVPASSIGVIIKNIITLRVPSGTLYDTPFIDHLRLPYKIDLDITFDRNDLTSLQKALQPYGLTLTPSNEITEVMVFKDRIDKKADL